MLIFEEEVRRNKNERWWHAMMNVSSQSFINVLCQCFGTSLYTKNKLVYEPHGIHTLVRFNIYIHMHIHEIIQSVSVVGWARNTCDQRPFIRNFFFFLHVSIPSSKRCHCHTSHRYIYIYHLKIVIEFILHCWIIFL